MSNRKVACEYCLSINDYGDPSCVRCGAPLGNAEYVKIAKVNQKSKPKPVIPEYDICPNCLKTTRMKVGKCDNCSMPISDGVFHWIDLAPTPYMQKSKSISFSERVLSFLRKMFSYA